jgi:tetratricopeptide (TPR) repeat protein
MESVKVIFFLLAFSVTANVNGQYNEKVLKAFENSYAAEKEGNITKSASFLLETYQENSYEFNLRLGWLHFKAGMYQESKLYYKKALNLLPYSEEARFGLILPTTALKEWDDAVRLYNQILENNPGSTIALYRLGLLYYEKMDWHQASKCFQKVVDLYPFEYDGLLMLAWTNLQLGKTREAKILFNKVILWSPGDKSALEGLKLLK